ncbi:hypothetical protein ABZ470_39430 [Streptosporangium sp. NPDC020072]|uniref:hypothetical protein n=1 Tax=Streptosporangium sp. NPDC020072 TaxID=3154788 RepID=UPI0034323034
MAIYRVYLAPEGAQPRSTAFPAFVKANGSAFAVSGLAFDAATAERTVWKLEPFNYSSGDLSVDVVWYADTATSGAVRWEVFLAAITPGVDTDSVETKAMSTGVTAVASHLGGTGKRLHKTTVTLPPALLDSMAAGDEVWLRLGRDAADSTDTMTGDVVVTSVRLTYTGT